MEKRCSFELFKSNVCHWLKEEGDIDFLVIGRWKVEEFLEDKRKQDFRNYLNGVSGNRA